MAHENLDNQNTLYINVKTFYFFYKIVPYEINHVKIITYNMTIIVALLDSDGVIHMGGDSSASNDTDAIDICGNEKIFHSYSYMYGICGSFRVMNIIRYIFDPPAFTWYDNDTPMHFMVQCFVPMLIKVLRSNKTLEKDNNVVSMDATMIVGFQGNLFAVDSDFQVRQLPPENFFAIGSGAEAAKGDRKSVV